MATFGQDGGGEGGATAMKGGVALTAAGKVWPLVQRCLASDPKNN